MRPPFALSLLCLTGCMGDISMEVEPDAQVGAVGTVDVDAGTSTDAGAAVDAGAHDAGAGAPDAGPPSHASCSHSPDVKGSTARSALGNPYQAYVPGSYDPSRPMPLVVALHGAGDTAPNYLQFMWQASAEARGFIVIAPEGTFAYGAGFAWHGDDDALVIAAMEDVVKCYSIDSKRVILNGFSAGGTMAYFIGLSQAQRFSGLAIQSSALSAGEYVNGGGLLPAAWHVPVSHFHGDADMNFTAASALDGIETLMAAGHPTFWHLFSGGHQATAQDALTEYDELKTFTAP